MNYERILKMREELRHVKSNFVSISIEDYNALLKITEDITCIDSSDEVELDVADLRDLVDRCIKYYD